MIISKGLLLHSGIFLIASTLALRAFTKGEDVTDKDGTVEIWGGTAAKVDRIEFESKARKVTLEAAEDENGRYFIGTLVRPKPGERPADSNDPHKALTPPDVNDPKIPKETTRFVGVTETQTLSGQLAPMKALRFLGKLDKSRLGEFGFDQDHGLVKVTLAGKTHQLALGGQTPGGSDAYARDPDSGEGYVISGNITQPLQQADSRLVEHDLHAFATDDVERVRITKGAASRELSRNAEQKGFWSDPRKADTKDETSSNWMSKLDRLRVSSYLENPAPPVNPQDLVVRVEYIGHHEKRLGYLELVTRPPMEGAQQKEYCVKTEHIRWYASVLRSVGEQIEQDIGSVLAQ